MENKKEDKKGVETYGTPFITFTSNKTSWYPNLIVIDEGEDTSMKLLYFSFGNL